MVYNVLLDNERDWSFTKITANYLQPKNSVSGHAINALLDAGSLENILYSFSAVQTFFRLVLS